MIRDQAIKIVDQLRDAAVPSDWPDGLYAQAVVLLMTLPFEWARERAERWCVTPAVDGLGRPAPKYLNALPDVLTAVGIPADLRAREMVLRASRVTGAKVLPDLRSEWGLSYVGPTDPLPQGVYEYLVHNQLPIPDQPLALPTRAPARIPLGKMAEQLRAKYPPPARPVRKTPGAMSINELEEYLKLRGDVLPPEIQQAVLRLRTRVAAEAYVLEQQRLAYEEQIRLMEEERREWSERDQEGNHP